MPNAAPKLFLRLGSHSEKQYVIKTAQLFEGVIVGANLLESTPGATVSLAVRLIGNGGLFAIDPMTYTFGMDLHYIESETLDRASKLPGRKKRGLKKSFAAMAERYGEPLSTLVLKKKRSINPGDFPAHTLSSFARTVLEYQVARMRLEWESDPQLREVAGIMPGPSFVFAPYFYFGFDGRGDGWRDWLRLNISLAQEFSALDMDVPKHAVLCTDADVLGSQRHLDEIAQRYIESGCSACWMWLSNFNESSIRANDLTNLVRFVHRFRDSGIQLFNMHGGFLSALLSKHGLTGFSHGVGYGEAKDVIPVIGVTVPTVNYHLPPIHIRVPMLEVERSLQALKITDSTEFHQRVCDCTVCKGVLKGDVRNIHEFGEMVTKPGNVKQSQTPESAKKCRFHYLLARRKELDYISANSLDGLKKQLQDAYAEYSALPFYLGLASKASHLKTWASGI